jgi:hypothetical protein
MLCQTSADGMLDLDFVATHPAEVDSPGSFSKITPVAKTIRFLPGWQGVPGFNPTPRIDWKRDLSGASIPSAAVLMGEGLPLPWPFPEVGAQQPLYKNSGRIQLGNLTMPFFDSGALFRTPMNEMMVRWCPLDPGSTCTFSFHEMADVRRPCRRGG